MHVKSSFKNFKKSQNVMTKINEESKSLSKFFNGRFSMNWSVEKNHKGDCTVSIKIDGPHFHYKASSSNGSFYKAVTEVVAKIDKQLCRKKEKLRSKINRKNYESPRHSQVLRLIKSEEREEFYIEEDVLIAA